MKAKRLTVRARNKKKREQTNRYTPTPNRVAGTFLPKDNSHVTSSSLERLVMQYLDANNIAYVHQYQVGCYYFDFLIGKNVLLEVNGSYFHGFPPYNKKNKPFSGLKRQRARDKKKARLAVRKGFTYRVLWEVDIVKGNWKIITRSI